ncbi:hypothetical protein DRN62_02320 [Nanoarchaeota archaeon]|nr:MAG: hypothetical protein DRN62_02320 [Nanoarchaeota archaeon]
MLEVKLLKPREIGDGLVRKLHEVAEDGFGKKVPMEEVKHNTLETNGIFVVYDDNEPMGFTSYELRDIDGIRVGFLRGTVIRRAFQGRGLFKHLCQRLIRVFEEEGIRFVATRTQNPRVYRALQRLLPELYPTTRGEVPESVFELAKKIRKDVTRELIIPGLYGRQLTGEKVLAKEESVNALFSKLNTEEGDAYLLIGLLKKR